MDLSIRAILRFLWWPSVPLGVSSGSERRRPQGGRRGGSWNHGSFQLRLVERKGKFPMLPCESQRWVSSLIPAVATLVTTLCASVPPKSDFI
uniref:Secreted protein n=1 Tax=Aegilops tauschii subsp. strangulata TaxID=200361 RepID=A0A453N912_AEGTS